MNLDYLQKEIIPLRKKEIEKGKNLATRQPIYVVLDLRENYFSGHHDDYSLTTNYKGKKPEHGYVDENLDSECREFKLTQKRMKQPCEHTRFYTDRIIGFFLTSKAAHDYLKYQKHNLRSAYVYVFSSGYANIEMDALLNGM